MKERIWNIIAAILGIALFAVAMFVGCRALHRDPELWLFATAGLHSPRGAATGEGRNDA